MAKKQLSIRVEDNLLCGLDRLIPSDGATTTYKIETLIKMNMLNYNKALKSLIGKFSYLEACYMAQAFNGLIIQRDLLNTAEIVYKEISDFFAFGSMGFYSDEELDVKGLLNKIENLNDYQALVLLNTIEDFWNDGNKDIYDLIIVKN